jgi:predicted Na+-dependent transporter
LQLTGLRVVPTIHVFIIFLMMGLTLNIQQAWTAIKAPTELTLGLAINLVVSPLVGYGVLELPFEEPAFATGFAIFCATAANADSIALVRSVSFT